MSDKPKTKKIILSASFIIPVIPVSSSVIIDGAILIIDGKIQGIGDANEIKSKNPHVPCRHFNDSVLLPCLINAHIHLEYSALGAMSEPADFIAWIEGLIRRQRLLSDDEISSAISAAIKNMICSGVTSIGEICRSGLSLDELIRNGLKGVFYSEIVAIDDKRKNNIFTCFKTTFEKYKNAPNAKKLKLGIFPHSPYTLSQSVLEEVSAFFKAENIPCGIHAEESKYEKDFIRDGSGKISDFVNKFNLDTAPEKGKWNDTIEYLDSMDFLTPMTHLVHLTHIDERYFPLLERKRVGIVLCPRSNFLLNNGAFPFRSSLKYNLKMGLGTDSLASNYSLDMFEEMRALKRLIPSDAYSPSELNKKILRIATIGGAEVLGIDNETGSLSVGKSADIIAVKINSALRGRDSFSPIDYLIDEASSSDVTLTMIDGVIKHDISSRSGFFTHPFIPSPLGRGTI